MPPRGRAFSTSTASLPLLVVSLNTSSSAASTQRPSMSQISPCRGGTWGHTGWTSGVRGSAWLRSACASAVQQTPCTLRRAVHSSADANLRSPGRRGCHRAVCAWDTACCASRHAGGRDEQFLLRYAEPLMRECASLQERTCGVSGSSVWMVGSEAMSDTNLV